MDEGNMYGNEFQEFAPEVRNRIMDFVFEIITPARQDKTRAEEICEMLRFLIPDEYKGLVAELEDITLEDKIKSIEKTTFFIFKNSEKIKESILGI